MSKEQPDVSQLSMDDKIQYFEKKRKKAMIFAIITIIIAVCTFVSFLLFYIFEFAAFMIPLIVFIAVFFVFGGLFGVSYNNYKKFYKQHFVKLALEGMFDDLEYKPTYSISRREIEETHIIKRGNVFRGDDFISASYHGIPFIHSDITIQYETNNGKNSSTTTYFKGKWMAFDFNKDFSEYVIIAEKKGNAAIDKKTNNKVEMESADFNSKFRVYATDDHTAFYLITPQFVVNLEKISNETKGQLILGFVNGKLHIAINSGKNALEPKLFSKVSSNVIDSIRAEMKVVTDFLDALAVDKPNFRVDKIDSGEKTNSNDPFEL